MNFDEINSLKEYFAPMDLSESDKERRVELAELIEDVILLFFSSFLVFMEYGKVAESKQYFVDSLYDKLEDAVLNVTGTDEYLQKHLKTLSQEVVDTTYKNIYIDSFESSPINLSTSVNMPPIADVETFPTEPLVEDFGESSMGGSTLTQGETEENTNTYPYWLSEKRAFFIAGNEANTILNYSDFANAVYEGKTQKQWLTMQDERVRINHAEINGQIIGIEDLFVVGDSAMRFPHDEEYSASPKEIINCRCSCRYF